MINNETQTSHRLDNVVLAQWHHFELETIPFLPGANLISGINGSGKTTILDAMQLVLTGGSQKKTKLNASKGGDKSSAAKRSIKAYCLGGNEGDSYSRPNANTSIFLNWYDHDDQPYTTGLTITASETSTEINIRSHILTGGHLTEDELLGENDEFITCNELSRNLRERAEQSRGRVKYDTFSGVKATQDQFSAAWSASKSQQIEGEQLADTVASAMNLNFKQGVDPFIRSLVLPEDPIRMADLREDLVNHKHIADQLKRAKEQMEEREKLINEAQKITNGRIDIHNYTFAEHSAGFHLENEKLKRAERKKAEIAEKISGYTAKIEQLEVDIPRLTREFKNASEAYFKSDSVRLDQNLLDAKDYEEALLAQINKGSADLKKQVDKINLIRLENLEQTVPSYLELQHHLEQLQYIAAESKILNISPQTVSANKEVLDDQSHFKKAQEDILHASSVAEIDLQKRYDAIEAKGRDIKDRIDNLERGGTDLNKSTVILINALAEDGIIAEPMCDYCDIPDADWSEAVERYFGGRRESLIVKEEDFGRAMKIFNQMQYGNVKARSASIINPQKVRDSSAPQAGTVAALIATDHPIARGYVNLVAGNVRLAESEEELKTYDRGLMKTGLTSGTGAISILRQFMVLGKAAREKHLRV